MAKRMPNTNEEPTLLEEPYLQLEYLEEEILIDDTRPMFGVMDEVQSGDSVLNNTSSNGTFVTLFRSRSHQWALFYLAGLTLAELITTLNNPYLGIILHYGILIALLLHSGFAWQTPLHRFFIVMTLPSLIRILSLSLPLSAFPLVYWYFASSIPIFVATLILIRQLKFKTHLLSPSKQHIPLQIFVILSGIALGFIEYVILAPQPLIESFTLTNFLISAFILLFSTGLMEELVFRDVMQQVTGENLGKHFSMIYVSLIFGVLHIGYGSFPDFIFVTLVGYYFAWIAYRTRSIFAVTIAHGLTNIILFLVAPFMFN